MPAPWVMFDSAASQGSNCTSGADPDIAGVGVVLSFVFASIMTTTASILAMLLDQAFDAKGQFTVRAPFKYIREHVFDTGWKKDFAWRPFLDPLIIGMGDQQLITGYAVLLSGWIKIAMNSFEVQSAHFVLILYICALSSSTHLAALITLRKYFRRYKLIAKIRIALVIVFALFLLASMIAAISIPKKVGTNDSGVTEQHRVQTLSFLVPMIFMLIGFTTAIATIIYQPEHESNLLRRANSCEPVIFGGCRRAESITSPTQFCLKIILFLILNPLISFIIQIVLATLSLVLVLSQKFSVPEEPDKWCGLSNRGDDVWGFGQTLSVVMLLLPAMSAGQTYLEGRQHIIEGVSPKRAHQSP